MQRKVSRLLGCMRNLLVREVEERIWHREGREAWGMMMIMVVIEIRGSPKAHLQAWRSLDTCQDVHIGSHNQAYAQDIIIAQCSCQAIIYLMCCNSHHEASTSLICCRLYAKLQAEILVS